MDAPNSPLDDPDFTGKSEAATSEASSATAIFGTVSPKSAPPQDDDLLKSLLNNQSGSPAPAEPKRAAPPLQQTQPWTPVVTPAVPQPPQSASNAGGFTEMFQALQNPAPAPGAPPQPTPSPASVFTPSNPKPADDLANVFTQVVVEKTAFSPSPPPAPAHQPGEFTQLLQTLSTSVQKPEPVAPPPAPPAAGSPGTFTQMFHAVSAGPAEA